VNAAGSLAGASSFWIDLLDPCIHKSYGENANGVPDGCDVEGGVSRDGNGDGQPDECSCPDTNASGAVDADDLLNVILDWGTTGMKNGGDVDASGLVDVNDLLTVVLGWGPCG
jgi:hypothetical protein